MAQQQIQYLTRWRASVQSAYFKKLFILPALASFYTSVQSQQALETGGSKPMPAEWIDKDTHHKLVRLTNIEGESSSFYFHNNPFIGNKMVFYNTGNNGRQLYTFDLTTKKVEQLTNKQRPSGEITGPKGRNVYYQVSDSIFVTNIDTKKTSLVFVFPEDFKASVTTLNADETLLGGVWATDAEKEIFRQNPAKGDYFTKIYEAKLPRTLFVIDVRTKQLRKLFTDSAWLNHVQFSSTDPSLLMFCHEGPWHLVDRLWTIHIKTKEVTCLHKRTVYREIAGHEFFSRDGKRVWFDWQIPRGETFYLGYADLATGEKKKYQMERDEWSIHFNISPDQKIFAGDGGDSGQVAKAKNGRWIYLFRPQGDKLVSEKLVNMQHHNYRLEPNVHFSPDGKWIIFRANFEGKSQVYAVEIASREPVVRSQ